MVAHLPGKTQQTCESVYCPRGEAKNRTRELFDVDLDRPIWSKLLGQQPRVFLGAAAWMSQQKSSPATGGIAWARSRESARGMKPLSREPGETSLAGA